MGYSQTSQQKQTAPNWQRLLMEELNVGQTCVNKLRSREYRRWILQRAHTGTVALDDGVLFSVIGGGSEQEKARAVTDLDSFYPTG
jgi:hypothetical protein